jgi:hypothetical protein
MKHSCTLDDPFFGVIGAIGGGGYLNNYTLNSPFSGIMKVVYGGVLLIWYNMCWDMIENYKRDSSN